MKKLSLLASLFAVALFMLNGCSKDESPANAPAAKEFFPLAQGSIRIERTAFLGAGNAEIAGSTRMDSLVLLPSENYQGKKSYMQLNYLDGTTLSTSTSNYVSNEGNAAYRYYSPVNLNGLSPVTFTQRWVKEADFNANAASWVTFDTTIKDAPVMLGGITATADVHIVQTRTKGAMTNVSYGSPEKTVAAQEFTATTNFKGTAKVMGQEFPFDFNNLEKLYFAENIGLVKNHRDYYEVMVGPLKQGITGFDLTLQRYTTK